MRLSPALACIALAGCSEIGVVRVMEGREVEGRFINERAYALYAAGADAEVRGDMDGALRAYGAAAEEDQKSPEIWTRIGALRCQRDPDGAREAFDRAAGYDAEYEPLWREQARCALGRGKLEEALLAASRAVELDPDRDETVILQASVLEHLKRPEDARRALDALIARHPRSAEAWKARYAFARRTGDVVASEEAARRVRELAPSLADDMEKSVAPLSALGEIDAALARGELPLARRRARSAHMTAGELAVRAAALGRADLARDEAGVVLAADPTDANARVALAVAADLARDEAALAAAMSGLPAPDDRSLVPPSPLARLLLAELLDRRVGAAAAQAWLGAAQKGSPADADPLLARIERRVHERLVARP